MNERLFLAGIFFIMGAACVWFGVAFLRKRGEMRRRGERALAKVIDVGVSTRVVRRNKRKYTETVYVCTLEYMALNERHTVRHVTREATEVGEVKVIVYLPEKPERYMLAENLTDAPINTKIPAGFAILGAILLVVSAVIWFQ